METIATFTFVVRFATAFALFFVAPLLVLAGISTALGKVRSSKRSCTVGFVSALTIDETLTRDRLIHQALAEAMQGHNLPRDCDTAPDGSVRVLFPCGITFEAKLTHRQTDKGQVRCFVGEWFRPPVERMRYQA